MIRAFESAAVVPVGPVYRFDQIIQAHTAMETDHTKGKLVVTTTWTTTTSFGVHGWHRGSLRCRRHRGDRVPKPDGGYSRERS